MTLKDDPVNYYGPVAASIMLDEALTAPLPPLEVYADDPEIELRDKTDEDIKSYIKMLQQGTSRLLKDCNSQKAEIVRLREKNRNQRRELKRLNQAVINKTHVAVRREIDVASLEGIIRAMGVQIEKRSISADDALRQLLGSLPGDSAL